MVDPVASLAEFQSLMEKRELAAFRCVSAVKVALCWFEAELYQNTEEHLRRAVAEFDAADQAILAFHKKHASSQQATTSSHQKEHSDGNRSAA